MLSIKYFPILLLILFYYSFLYFYFSSPSSSSSFSTFSSSNTSPTVYNSLNSISFQFSFLSNLQTKQLNLLSKRHSISPQYINYTLDFIQQQILSNSRKNNQLENHSNQKNLEKNEKEKKNENEEKRIGNKDVLILTNGIEITTSYGLNQILHQKNNQQNDISTSPIKDYLPIQGKHSSSSQNVIFYIPSFNNGEISLQSLDSYQFFLQSLQEINFIDDVVITLFPSQIEVNFNSFKQYENIIIYPYRINCTYSQRCLFYNTERLNFLFASFFSFSISTDSLNLYLSS